MERESFIFYRSFYEAIKYMPAEVRAELYPAICEYALFGKQPDNLSEVAIGMFTLIKPNIDVNTARFENGKKGAAYGKRGGRPRKTKQDQPKPYVMTFEQEVDLMKGDDQWRQSICDDYSITPDEFNRRLKSFLHHCRMTRSEKPHDSFDDARSHLRYWMSKAYPATEQSNPANDPDYTYKGGFGGIDT